MGFSDAEPVRIGLLFVIFTIVSCGFVNGNNDIEAYLRRKRLHALRHVLDAFREELLLLGFISLLLSVFDEALQKMCVRATVDALQVAADTTYGENTCPEGEAPFWNAKTLHQTHIFIFILACTHISYACVSMTLCVTKIRRWRKFEEEARRSKPGTQLLRPLAERLAPFGGQSGRRTGVKRLVWRSFVAQFLDSTNKDVYLDLRRLFIERTGAPQEFDFLSFLVESVQEDYAKIIGVNYFMWLLAAVYVMIPQFVFLPTSIMTLVVMLIMGTVLESIQLRLTECSYQLFRLAKTESSTLTLTNDLDLTPPPSTTAAAPVAAAAASSLPSTSPMDGESQQHRPREETRETRMQLARTVMARRLDAANFFFLGKPTYILKLFQFVLFENAMSLSMLTFSMWQDPAYLTSNIVYGLAAVTSILVVDFFTMMHASVFVLPVYAITASVGSHSSLSVSNLAKKKSVSGAHAMEIFRRQNHEGSSRGFHGRGERATRESRDEESGSGSDGGGSDTSVSAAQRRAWGRKWDKLGEDGGDRDDDGRLSDLEEDYEAENARSVTYLMGAILTKQLNDIRAKERLESLREMEHGSGRGAHGGGVGDSDRPKGEDEATIDVVETVDAASDEEGPGKSKLWRSPSSSSSGTGTDADSAHIGGRSSLDACKTIRRPMDRFASRMTTTPSLARLFSPDADDGISELDRMTGGLESCLADAAKVAEALEAVGGTMQSSVHGRRTRTRGRDDYLAGSIVSAPYEGIIHQIEAISLPRADSGVPSLASDCISPSPLQKLSGEDVEDTVAHHAEAIVTEAALGGESNDVDAGNVDKVDVWLSIDGCDLSSLPRVQEGG